MRDVPDAGPGPGQPEIIELGSVPGFVVLDLPGVAVAAGGTRMAPDVTVAEVALLARAMTYKFAVLGTRVGGAKAGLVGDPADHAARAGLMARYCAEIRPLADAGRFLTGPDMGTSEEDFALLRADLAAPAAISAVIGGVPFEDVLTGYGVTVAAETALRAGPGGGWEGRSVAIEGFGKVGGGVAHEVAGRGGRVVAVSTAAGCVTDPAGLDVGRLLALRRAHGDECIARYGLPVSPPRLLFTAVAADVLVPGTRPGVINRQTAESLPASVQVVAPAANVPYTSAGADVLRCADRGALDRVAGRVGAEVRPPAPLVDAQCVLQLDPRGGHLVPQDVHTGSDFLPGAVADGDHVAHAVAGQHGRSVVSGRRHEVHGRQVVAEHGPASVPPASCGAGGAIRPPRRSPPPADHGHPVRPGAAPGGVRAG